MNKKKTLFLVVSRSATGKDYAVDRICQTLGKKKVISRSTREPRYGGEKTHIFVPYSEGEKDWNDGSAIIKQYVQNKDRKDMYYVKREDLQDADFYLIFPTGVKDIEDHRDQFPEFEFVTIEIKTPLFTRVQRMIKRGDPKLGIIKRLIYEVKEFKGFKADITFKDNESMIRAFEKINK